MTVSGAPVGQEPGQGQRGRRLVDDHGLSGLDLGQRGAGQRLLLVPGDSQAGSCTLLSKRLDGWGVAPPRTLRSTPRASSSSRSR